jgi:hypothetical protein
MGVNIAQNKMTTVLNNMQKLEHNPNNGLIFEKVI